MSCKAAKFDPDEGRYYCEVSGDQCMYYIPNSKKCVEEYGEGPDSCMDDRDKVIAYLAKLIQEIIIFGPKDHFEFDDMQALSDIISRRPEVSANDFIW